MFNIQNQKIGIKFDYNQGIPDDEWYISPGKTGKSFDYFPHFKEENFTYLYWFGFYMDSYYTKFFSLIDAIYHLINVKYDMDIEMNIGFKSAILKKLKDIDIELHDFLNSIRDDEIYKKVSEYRNNIIHNYRPNQIDSGINTVKKEGKIIQITMTVGNYTKSSEFVKNINESLDLLASIIEEIRDKLKTTA